MNRFLLAAILFMFPTLNPAFAETPEFQPITIPGPVVKQLDDYLTTVRGPTWKEIGPIVLYLEQAENSAQQAAAAKAQADAKAAAEKAAKK